MVGTKPANEKPAFRAKLLADPSHRITTSPMTLQDALRVSLVIDQNAMCPPNMGFVTTMSPGKNCDSAFAEPEIFRYLTPEGLKCSASTFEAAFTSLINGDQPF
jgi:hypothetical protein